MLIRRRRRRLNLETYRTSQLWTPHNQPLRTLHATCHPRTASPLPPSDTHTIHTQILPAGTRTDPAGSSRIPPAPAVYSTASAPMEDGTAPAPAEDGNVPVGAKAAQNNPPAATPWPELRAPETYQPSDSSRSSPWNSNLPCRRNSRCRYFFCLGSGSGS